MNAQATDTKSRLRNPRTWWPVVLWVMFALLMVYSAVTDPFDPHVTDSHGRNGEHALLYGLGISLAELAVFMAVFAFGIPRRAWWRWLAAFVLILPWTAALAFFVQHAGSVHLMHVFWLFALLLGMFASVVYRALCALIRANAAGGAIGNPM